MDSKQSRKAATVIIRRGKSLGYVLIPYSSNPSIISSHFMLFLFRLLLYVAGIVYFYALTSDEMSRRGYFDENALMTGLVRREFTDQKSISKHAEEIKQLGPDRYGVMV